MISPQPSKERGFDAVYNHKEKENVNNPPLKHGLNSCGPLQILFDELKMCFMFNC